MSNLALEDWEQAPSIGGSLQQAGTVETIPEVTWIGKMMMEIDLGKEGDGQPEPAHSQQSGAHHKHARHSKDEHI